MHSSLKLLVSVLILGLGVAAPLTRAGDEPAGPPRERMGKRLRERAEQHDKMLVEKLKLTADQQQKLTEIRKNQREQMKAAEGDRAKMGEILRSGRDQIRAILTPEQQKEFDALKPEGPGHRRGERGEQ